MCGSNFSSFISAGTQSKYHVLCPNCHSLESTRLLWFYLSNEVLVEKNKNNFLYFKPEAPILERLKNLNISITEGNLEYLQQLGNLSSSEKFQGGHFDVIIFSHILQYIKNEQPVFDELKRLLKPSGSVILLTIVNWEMERTYENPHSEEDIDRLKHYFELGVERIYGSDFKKYLMRAGFHVEVIDYADELGADAKDYYQLGSGNREIIFKCKKV